MVLPVHRWFRFSGAFSAPWVESVIAREARRREVRVFDPFAGSGTTLIAAERCGVESLGMDPHPFVARIARAKLAYRSSADEFMHRAGSVLSRARRRSAHVESHAPLIRECYADESLGQLDRLRRTIEAEDDGSDAARLVWLTLVSILRTTSHVRKPNRHYRFPARRQAQAREPFAAFEEMVHVVYGDMRSAAGVTGPRATYRVDDARRCDGVRSAHYDLVVTSPPYANNYDYADATRLEQTFFGEVEAWQDARTGVRRHLLRASTRQVPDTAVDLSSILDRSELGPVRDEIRSVCQELGAVRLTRRGRKTYHHMIGCYFLDLAHVWQALRRVCASPSRVCFVIGDAAPYGVYVPAFTWLGRLAVAAGFRSFTFEKTRDRRTRWKNWTHPVPLCEGHLWVEG